jgi:iron complex outermembrane recepter protein
VFAFGLDADLRTYNRYGDDGESEVDAWTIDNQLQAKVVTGPLAHTLLFGLDYQRDRLSDVGRAFDGPSLAIDIFDPVYGEKLHFAGLYQETVLTQQQCHVPTELDLGTFLAVTRFVLTAQYLYSAIFPIGSSCGLVHG